MTLSSVHQADQPCPFSVLHSWCWVWTGAISQWMPPHFSLDEPSVKQAQPFSLTFVNLGPHWASRFALGSRKEDNVPWKGIAATSSCKAKTVKGPKHNYTHEYAISTFQVSFGGLLQNAVHQKGIIRLQSHEASCIKHPCQQKHSSHLITSFQRGCTL